MTEVRLLLRQLLIITLCCYVGVSLVNAKGKKRHQDASENGEEIQNLKEHEPPGKWKATESRLKAEVENLQKSLVAKDHMLKEAQKEAIGIREAFNGARADMKSLKRALQFEKKKEAKLLQSYEKEHVKYGETTERLKELETKLDETIDRAENPEITKWLTRRAEDVGLLLDSPRTGQILGESVSSMLTSSSDTIHSLESSLESNLSAMVAETPYSEAAAVVFSYLLILMPVAFIVYVMKRLTKSISIRQYILLGHLFNIGLVCACLLLSLIFGEDPFSSMRRASNRKAVILMVFLALQCPVFLLLTFWASFTGSTLKEKIYFAVQAFFYTLVAINYRARVWKPVMSGDASTGMMSVYGYSVYMVAIALMIYFTVAAAKARRNETVVADIENLVKEGYRDMNGEGKVDYEATGKAE